MHPWICRRRIPFLKSSIYLHKFPIFPHNIPLLSFSTEISILDYLVNHHHFSPESAAKVSSLSSTKYLYQEKLKGFVQRVDEMGFQRHSNMFFQAVRAMSCMSRENWELKLQVFRDLGFSEDDILATFRKYPLAFAVSERKIKDVIQLLLSVEDSSISEIVSDPLLLTLSVEKRVKPRAQVLKALLRKNLLKKKPKFSTFCRMTDANFTTKYLIPYSDELGDLCVASPVKEKHTISPRKLIQLARKWRKIAVLSRTWPGLKRPFEAKMSLN